MKAKLRKALTLPGTYEIFLPTGDTFRWKIVGEVCQNGHEWQGCYYHATNGHKIGLGRFTRRRAAVRAVVKEASC